MKIVKRDNFDRDLFTEIFVAENVHAFYGKQLVDLHNDKHWDDNSESFLELVEDDYELYDGYAELL